ncbi:hypothetical protein ACFL04_04570 [Patescibacteria group bacterium]
MKTTSLILTLILVITIGLLIWRWNGTTENSAISTTANNNTDQIKTLTVKFESAIMGDDTLAVKAVMEEIGSPSGCVWWGITGGISGYTGTSQGGLFSSPPWQNTMTLACPSPPAGEVSPTEFGDGTISFAASCRDDWFTEYRVAETVVRWDDPLCDR